MEDIQYNFVCMFVCTDLSVGFSWKRDTFFYRNSKPFSVPSWRQLVIRKNTRLHLRVSSSVFRIIFTFLVLGGFDGESQSKDKEKRDDTLPGFELQTVVCGAVELCCNESTHINMVDNRAASNDYFHSQLIC